MVVTWAGNSPTSTSRAAFEAAATGDPDGPGDLGTVRLVALFKRLHGVMHREVDHGEVDHRRRSSSRYTGGCGGSRDPWPNLSFQSEMTSAPAVLAQSRTTQAGRKSFLIRPPY